MLRSPLAAFLATSLLALPAASAAAESPSPTYAIVVSGSTRAAPGWKDVVGELTRKHAARVISWQDSVDEALEPLRAAFPRHTCFVAQPGEADREFVAKVHRLTRRVDDDPYTDTLWAILTGYDAANALRIARQRDPLVVRRVASGTDVALEMCEEGVWYCELQKHRMVRKAKGGKPEPQRGPADTTEALAKTLTDYRAQLFVTSGHATERDWQIGFRYKNGSFRSQAGKLFGVDTSGRRFPIEAPEPKVYLPIGNCLMGHIDGPDAMALAFMNSAGVHQMIGYTVPTWYGYAGWGCLDYFVEQPGRYTFVEAFHANQRALVHRLETKEGGPGATRGLQFDRDVVALYGDPAWEARMAPGPCAWEQSLVEKDGVFTFVVTPKRGDRSFAPINTNGSQRGGRPIIQYLPWRVRDVEVVEGANLEPVITDDFLLVPLPPSGNAPRSIRLVFRAGWIHGPDADPSRS